MSITSSDDFNRVKLKDSAADYINASHIHVSSKPVERALGGVHSFRWIMAQHLTLPLKVLLETMRPCAEDAFRQSPTSGGWCGMRVLSAS